MKKNKKTTAVCEKCAYYNYDDEFGGYVCDASPDEDELARFLQGDDCRYYRPYDEYSVVRKQN